MSFLSNLAVTWANWSAILYSMSIFHASTFLSNNWSLLISSSASLVLFFKKDLLIMMFVRSYIYTKFMERALVSSFSDFEGRLVTTLGFYNLLNTSFVDFFLFLSFLSSKVPSWPSFQNLSVLFYLSSNVAILLYSLMSSYHSSRLSLIKSLSSTTIPIFSNISFKESSFMSSK